MEQLRRVDVDRLEGNQSLCIPQERREMEPGEQDCQEHTPQREDS